MTTKVQTNTADELIAERDEVVQRIIGTLRDMRSQLNELSGLEDELFAIHGVRSPVIFGNELAQVLDYQLTQRASLYPELFGGRPRKSRQEQLVLSCEANLERAREHLKSLQSQKGKVFTLKRRHFEPSQDDFDNAAARVQDCERALARARGTLDEYDTQQRARVQEQRERERQEAADSITSYQRGWRAYADKLRDKQSAA